ncbi:MAG: peptide-methionine (S)-S-oxide reductase [Candidatus Magasanikbacteria bacterium CG11_big_fil_rev_8_21_14_0_20_39_34]|uniref:Peptide methionine sulfoxide reductase MsrA n=1 Tax=Candidatus Magasanikbacteria bacterium CG11_big_fil_rev_8_21_14_0_20_39_34 TaxID=1974653 RepID=A0A2H0N5V0_9BACT|nr:MAG: peptide-methionine (S)-S-oxide reductase [Candidatus Magasanikbacteria bacterium CG11_big_fil_rev_8_21_14_0_20_39_34]
MLEPVPSTTLKATFSGGCFWCMEPAFEKIDGTYNVLSGYTGDSKETAEYYKVGSGKTQHRESIEMDYDPAKVTYDHLVEVYFWQIDPTDGDGQFADRGYQYSPAIYYHTEEQRKIAEDYIRMLEDSHKFDKPIAVEVLPAMPFYSAEIYHQDFYKKNPTEYNRYKKGSGRVDYIEKTWPEGHPDGM